jgi:hypothetical protein
MSETEVEPVTDVPREYPPGDYAIVEIFGHTTLVGRIQEVERFGTKMLAIEPLFADAFLPVILQGGGSIYRLTQVPVELAFKRQPRKGWQLPEAIRLVVPEALLPPPDPVMRHYAEDDDDGAAF